VKGTAFYRILEGLQFVHDSGIYPYHVPDPYQTRQELRRHSCALIATGFRFPLCHHHLPGNTDLYSVGK